MDFLKFAEMSADVYYDITRHSCTLDSNSLQIACHDILDLSLFCTLRLESGVYILAFVTPLCWLKIADLICDL
jgi:hypothetical protein